MQRAARRSPLDRLLVQPNFSQAKKKKETARSLGLSLSFEILYPVLDS